MRMERLLSLGVGAAFLFGASSAPAADDIDLRLNGDFRGSEVGAAIAPGWAADAQAGGTRIVRDPALDRDEFALLATAPAGVVKSIAADFIPVQGSVLKLDLKMKGRGSAAFGFFAFDASKNRISSADAWETVALQGVWGKYEKRFSLNDPNVKFIRVGLLVNPESEAMFTDVDGEFILPSAAPVAPAPVPPAPVPPSVPQTLPAPPPAAQPPAPALQAAPTLDPGMPPPKPLFHDKFYSLREIGDAPCSATIPVGSDIDFDLEQDSARGIVWKLESYDARVVRVKLEHDRDRNLFGRVKEKLEVELKGVAPGTTPVIFSAPGKRFVVLLTVR